jgi:hypothetical protein
MFDWMIASQLATTLYIYRVGGLALQILLYNSKSSQAPNSTRNRGDPVRLPPGGWLDRLAPLCQTDYRTPGQTAHRTRSNRLVWPESAFANFECQHMPPCFLVKLAC